MKTESSFCPSCQKNVWLLYSNSFFLSSVSSSDAFYVCFSCEFIGQIGVGRVEVDQAVSEVENDSI